MDKPNNKEWIAELSKMAVASSRVSSSLYTQYDVKRGLRDIHGKGVLAGLTQIGEVLAHPEGDETGPGNLIYRGRNIEDLVAGFLAEGRPGYEETCYLLLGGKLPTREKLAGFQELLSSLRELPHYFIRDSMLALSSRDVMNAMAQHFGAIHAG